MFPSLFRSIRPSSLSRWGMGSGREGRRVRATDSPMHTPASSSSFSFYKGKESLGKKGGGGENDVQLCVLTRHCVCAVKEEGEGGGTHKYSSLPHTSFQRGERGGGGTQNTSSSSSSSSSSCNILLPGSLARMSNPGCGWYVCGSGAGMTPYIMARLSERERRRKKKGGALGAEHNGGGTEKAKCWASKKKPMHL